MQILVARAPAELDAAFERLSAAPALGCDTETSSLSARGGRIFSLQFSDGEFCVLVPLSEGVGPGPLANLLADDRVVKIFHNAKFDLDFLRENGLEANNVFCTMIAEKLLTKGAGQSSSLADTLYRYFAVDLDKTQRAKFNKSWDGIWTPELVDYALSDVVHLPRLYREQTTWLERLGLTAEYESKTAALR